MSAPALSMVITNHAAARYLERVRPEGDRREAFTVLRDAATRCVKTGRTWHGQVMWSVDNPDMRLITKHDPIYGMICVTVLGPEEPWGPIDEPPPPRAAERSRALSPAQVANAARLSRHEQRMAAQRAEKEAKARRHAELVARAKAAERARHARRIAGEADVARRRAAGLIRPRGAPSSCPTCQAPGVPVASEWTRVDDKAAVCAVCDTLLDLTWERLGIGA